ncbi:hydroxymethylbilane synthase [Cutibacterium acnes]|nr:hydroxymethylbilane synthase [Cutibacterium acnes]MCP9385037.1 hydroxymethylbilane synthase [Cutibacterium acnes]
MTQSAYLDDHDSVIGERACHADVDTGLTAVSRCAEVNRKIDTPQTVTR